MPYRSNRRAAAAREQRGLRDGSAAPLRRRGGLRAHRAGGGAGAIRRGAAEPQPRSRRAPPVRARGDLAPLGAARARARTRARPRSAVPRRRSPPPLPGLDLPALDSRRRRSTSLDGDGARRGRSPRRPPTAGPTASTAAARLPADRPVRFCPHCGQRQIAAGVPAVPQRGGAGLAALRELRGGAGGPSRPAPPRSGPRRYSASVRCIHVLERHPPPARRRRGHHGRRGRDAALSADQGSLQAGGAARGQVPPGGHPHQQLPQLRPPPDLPPHPVQQRLAPPPHPGELPVRHLLARLRRDPRGRAAPRPHRLVPGHRRRRPAEPAAHQFLRRTAWSSSCRATSSTG